MAMLRPHDRGWSPWAVQSPRPRPGLHLALVPFVPGVGGGSSAGPGAAWGSCRDVVSAHVGVYVPRCGILGSVGGWHRPYGRPAATRHTRMACTEAWVAPRDYCAPHTVRNGGAQNPNERDKCATDAGIRCTRCQETPPHAKHTRLARSGHGRPRAVLARGYPANTSHTSDRCVRRRLEMSLGGRSEDTQRFKCTPRAREGRFDLSQRRRRTPPAGSPFCRARAVLGLMAWLAESWCTL